MKKGQVTYFIAAGITILIAAFFIMYFLRGIDKEFERPDNIETFISSCLDKSGKDAISYLGLRGGFINPTRTISVSGRDITVLSAVPDRETLERYLAIKAEEYIIACADIERFHGRVRAGSPEVSASIMESTVLFEMKYPIEAEYDGTTHSFNDFSAVIDARIGHVFEEIGKNIDSYRERGMYNLSHLEALDFRTTAYDYDGHIIFDFNDGPVRVVYALS